MSASRCADERISNSSLATWRYVDDINLRGILCLAILRSAHAHALITDVDLSTARAAAGVRLALAGADLSGEIGNIKPNWVVPGTVVPERPVMAVDRVRFVGESRSHPTHRAPLAPRLSVFFRNSRHPKRPGQHARAVHAASRGRQSRNCDDTTEGLTERGH